MFEPDLGPVGSEKKTRPRLWRTLLTIIGIFVAIALTGTVLTETVFTRPGLGKMLVDAIGARD